MTDTKKVLLTGAAGRIATFLRNGLGDRYALSGTDRIPVADAGFESVTANLTDFDAILPAFDGMDTVVHLAAEPRHTPDIWWDPAAAGQHHRDRQRVRGGAAGRRVPCHLLQLYARQRLL